MNNLRLRILYYTLVVWGRGTKRILYYRPLAWARGMRTKLKVIRIVLRGKPVCYRALFNADVLEFFGRAPEMVQCSFWQAEEGSWFYTYGRGEICAVGGEHEDRRPADTIQPPDADSEEREEADSEPTS